ncbi:MAG TPA: S9 family peptidase [Ferruginibacter sp.]|nr:S9 family peptidase [Ferruginibacter sp.]
MQPVKFLPKKFFYATACTLALAGIFSCNSNSSINMKREAYEWPNVAAPIAEKKAKDLTAHGDIRSDPYYWMNDYFKKGPDSNNVVKYLEAENKYYDTMMAGTKGLQEKLYNEMKGRIKEDDESVPYLKNGYYYYNRVVKGKDYYVLCRKKGSLDAKEEVMLDVNAMAEGHSYFSVSGTSVSPDNKLLAFGVDTVSRRQYVIYIKNLETGEIYKDAITGTEADAVWAADNKTIFYTSKNPVTLLSEKIKRHVLGTDQTTDVVVYEEKDPTNYIGVGKTKSDKYILIYSSATLTTEVRYLAADQPTAAFQIFQPRIKDVKYDIDHAGDKFYIRTNKNARNFKVVTCPETKTDTSAWVDYIPHNDSILIEGFDVFKNFIAVSERKNGLTQIHIIQTANNQSHYIDFGEPTYAAYASGTPEYNTETLRYYYTSLTTPGTQYDYNMQTKEKKLLKQLEVVGGYSAADYTTERLYAKASDGTSVPISIVYKKGFKKDGSMPLLLYGYGSYGSSMDASFSIGRISLLDRGFAYAIAHIRGGQEMGRYWYEDGKMFKKKNTFTDFISCAEFLIENKFTTKEHLYTMGGSAGGLLMGAIVNMRPDLWKGVVAQVPFVDVLTTMSDPTIPLTTNEYDEWGNPANKESYHYMKSYSPYDNVKKQAYPNMLVTTGLHDSQVQYFEPAKWVARLREMKTDSNHILLHTDMEVGHGGASGRFKSLWDRAREFAFFFALEGIKD